MARQQLARGARRDRTLADVGPAFEAAPAAAAAHVEGEADMVAHLHVVHARAQLDDLARALVAQHDRHRTRPVAVDQRQVGMAEPGAAHLDQHLALAGRIEIDFDDMDGLRLGEGPRRTADRENAGFHLHSGCNSSVDPDQRSGGEARFARGEIERRRHDLLRLAAALERRRRIGLVLLAARPWRRRSGSGRARWCSPAPWARTRRRRPRSGR